MPTEFNLETFIMELLLHFVQTLKQSQLQQLITHFKLPTTSTMKKE